MTQPEFNLRFMFTDNFQWVEVPPQKDSPPRLEGHTMVVYQGRIYIFGGETSFASADESPLWSYNIEESVWSKICSHGTLMVRMLRQLVQYVCVCSTLVISRQ